MDTITQAYAAEIVKAERDDAGDLIVYGKSTGPDVDLDAQVCDPEWLKQAMPAWMEWGNLREMHQPIAAGVGLELEQQGDDWMLKSKVVDEGTARKIEAGALKGYSVGIKNARVVKDASAPGGRIVAGEIVEVSYVDRPCNPTATLAIAKAAGAQAELAPVDAADQDRARAVELVNKAIGPDGQVDETADIEGGKAAIALLAGLIKAEADELAAGHLDEVHDISLLLRAVELLRHFVTCEAKEREGVGADADGEVAYVGLAARLGLSAKEAHALPDATKAALTELAKRDFSAEQRRQAAEEGYALPDGSFPIKTRDDLKNAIRLAGHAKDPAKARAHIKRRAKELGAEDMIPESWKAPAPDTTKTTEPAPSAGPVSKDEVADLVKSAVAEATKAAQERIDALAAELAKVKATPIPGGPVVTATRPQQPKRNPDLDKAAYYEAMADQVTDPMAAAGYRQKAAELRKAAGQSTT